MDDLKIELNGYLFLEFGVEGDEARVAEDWPFQLTKLLESSELSVFEFEADDAYFALAGESLNFLPKAGMSVDDLLLQHDGAKWIGARDPIDLSVVRLGDPAVPSTIERRRQLEALGAEMLPGETVKVLEGLFLRSEQRYLALLKGSATSDAVVAGLPGSSEIRVPFPQASAWRRLAWGVGHWLTLKRATG
ncbi:MAG: hypothetical protein WBC51_12305 [Vicinamibacterales bacterium]